MKHSQRGRESPHHVLGTHRIRARSTRLLVTACVAPVAVASSHHLQYVYRCVNLTIDMLTDSSDCAFRVVCIFSAVAVQAADFFADEAAVAVLCKVLSTRLFPAVPPSRLVHVEGNSTACGCVDRDVEARAKGDAELVCPDSGSA